MKLLGEAVMLAIPRQSVHLLSPETRWPSTPVDPVGERLHCKTVAAPCRRWRHSLPLLPRWARQLFKSGGVAATGLAGIAQDQFCLCSLPLSEITDAIVLHEHPERCNQNALSTFLPNRPSAPALTKRPFTDRRLHADHVPDARAGWRAMSTECIDRAGHALASSHLHVGEAANIMRSRW
jgi:hypothetical protein